MKEQLLKKLRSEDKSEVREAIEALADYSDEEVVKEIVNVMTSVRSKAVLEAAKNTLSSFTDLSDVVCKEVVKLFNIEEPKLRHAAIDILSSYGNTCLNVVEEELLSHEDYNMRKFGLDVLSQVRTEEALTKIISAISDENPNVRFTALEYMGKFTEFKDKVIEGILKVLPHINDLYGLTTLASTVIYCNFKDNRLVQPIKDKLAEIDDPMGKHWLYKTLIFLGDEELYTEALDNAKSIGMEMDIKKDMEIFGH